MGLENEFELAGVLQERAGRTEGNCQFPVGQVGWGLQISETGILEQISVRGREAVLQSNSTRHLMHTYTLKYK